MDKTSLVIHSNTEAVVFGRNKQFRNYLAHFYCFYGNFRSESGGSMKNKEISNSCSVAIGTNKDFMDDDAQLVFVYFQQLY